MTNKKSTEAELWETLDQTYRASFGDPSGEYVDADELQVDLITPKQIVDRLNRTVIGQEDAKRIVATSVWNRLLSFKNEKMGLKGDAHYFEKTNILLVGSTGCGKTHLVKALSDAVSLPCTVLDATSVTAAGYVGVDVGDCLSDLISSTVKLVDEIYDTDRMSRAVKSNLIRRVAEHGIIYVDEADKVRCQTSKDGGRDVKGRSVQEQFLKILEGSEVLIKDPAYVGILDTSNILFIFGGSFSGLDETILSRTRAQSIGFSATVHTKEEKKRALDEANTADFVKYGMIPELMGRLSSIAILEDLDRDMIKEIFSTPDRCIMSQIINEFKSYDVEVSFTGDAIDYIVDKAMDMKLGARGLRAACHSLLLPLFFHLPSSPPVTPIIITKEMLIRLGEL